MQLKHLIEDLEELYVKLGNVRVVVDASGWDRNLVSHVRATENDTKVAIVPMEE